MVSPNRWNGKIDRVLGLDIEEAGPLVQSRITGAMEGIKARLTHLPDAQYERFDGRGMRDQSYKVMFRIPEPPPQG